MVVGDLVPAKPARFVRDARTERTMTRLREVPERGHIGYPALAEVIGADPQGEGAGILRGAVEALLREERIAFDVVENEGLVRLDDAGKVAKTSRYPRKMLGAAKRGQRLCEAVEHPEALPPEVQIRRNMHRSFFGAMIELTRPAPRGRLEKLIAERQQAISPGQTLKALSVILDDEKP